MSEANGVMEERKLVTMLFADLAGSTELGSQLDPERLRSILQSYFTNMAATIESWGGIVEKYIGDAVMAVFGVPASKEDDAERAVRAAIEMLDRLEVLNRDFAERHHVTLRVRIGVNTGEVIAHGGPTSQPIVTGDAVNVAARLEQAARPGTILAGERTYAVTRGAIRFDAPLPLELKGKAGIVQGYPVLGLEQGREGTRGSSGLWSKMVGRDREVESLLGSLKDVVERGRGRSVVVFGSAGIGKSRLVREFVGRARALHPDLSVHRGRCLAAGHAITYWALGEILRSALGIALDDSSDVTDEKLRGGVGEWLKPLDLPSDEVQRTTSALALTAGVTLEKDPLEHMEPEQVARQVARAWPLLLTALATRSPVLVVCEDLHWADDQLVEMFDRLADRSLGPVLIVATARPGFALDHAHPATGRDEASSFSLRPLTGDESTELVAEFLSGAALPEVLRAEILAKAEGNPLFVEEILRRLVDEGVLIRSEGGWEAVEGSQTTPLPDSIHALLAARIDSLASGEKRVLQEASVVGRAFWEEPVRRAVGDTSTGSALRALERKGFIVACPTSSFAGHAEFQFTHALVMDVAYASLPKARRARAHAEQAEWIDEVAGDRREEFAELIAHHYATAVDDEADLAWYDEPERRRAIERNAFDALLLAGTVARRRYSLRRAVELHGRAVQLAPTERERASSLESLGDDHNTGIHGDEAMSAYREAISILRGLPDADEARARLCMKAARMILEKSGAFSSRQDPALIDELVDEGIRCAADDEVLAWLRALRGAAAVWWLDAGADSISLDERIGSLMSVLGDGEADPFPELGAFAREYLCELYMIRGSYAEVVEMTRRAQLLDRIASVPVRALSLLEVGIWTMQVAGEADRALELVMRSHRLAKELSPHELMHASGFLIAALYQTGRWSELDAVLVEHVAAFAQESDSTCEMLQGGVLAGATCLAQRGDLKRSRELEAMAPPFVVTDPLWAGYADGWRARLQVAAGDPRKGLRQAEAMFGSVPVWRRFHLALVLIDALIALRDLDALSRFVPAARELSGGMVVLLPTCDRAQGWVAAASGDGMAALRSLDRAVEGFDRLNVPFEAARTRELLASVSSPKAARGLLEHALHSYEKLGAAPHAERARTALSN